MSVHQSIIYDFQMANDRFSKEIEAMYKQMKGMGLAAKEASSSVKKMSDGSGFHRFKDDASRVDAALKGVGISMGKVGNTTRDVRFELGQINKLISTIGAQNKRDDATTAATLQKLHQQKKLLQEQYQTLRANAQSAAAAARQQREALTIQRQQNNALKDMMWRAAQVAATYLSIQQAAKAVSVGVDFNMMLEQNQMAFSVMLKSNALAGDLISKLREIQTTTGVGIREGAEGAKQLLAYGFQNQEIIQNLLMLKTVAGAVNAPLQDIVYVYGTLRAQGRAYTRDIMQFAMRGIPIYEALSKVMGEPVGRLKALTEEGRVGFDEVRKAMEYMTSASGQFGGMLEARMQTLTGKMDLLGKQFESTMGLIMQPSSPAILKMVEETTKFLQDLNTDEIGASMSAFMNQLAKVLPDVTNLAAALFKTVTDGLTGLLAVADVLMPVLSTLAQVLSFVAAIAGSPVVGALIGVGAAKLGFGVMGGAFSMINSAANPTASAGAVAAMSQGAGAFKTAMGNFKGAVDGVMATPFFKVALWTGIAGAVLGLTTAVISATEAYTKDAVSRGFAGTSADRAAATQRMLAAEGFMGADTFNRSMAQTAGGSGAASTMTLDQVNQLAKKYQLSVVAVASALRDAGMLNDSLVVSLINSKTSGQTYGVGGPTGKSTGYITPNSQFASLFGQDILGKYTTDQLIGFRDEATANIAPLQRAQDSSTSQGQRDYYTQQIQDVAQKNWEMLMGKRAQLTEMYIKDGISKEEAANLAILNSDIAFYEQYTKKKDDILKMDLWTVRELQAQLTEERFDDIQLEHDKRVQSYQDQVVAKTMTEAQAAQAIALSQQLTDQETAAYRKQLDDEAFMNRMNQINQEAANRKAVEESIIRDAAERRQAMIAASDPLAWTQGMGEGYQAQQGEFFTQAGMSGQSFLDWMAVLSQEGANPLVASNVVASGASAVGNAAGGLAMGAGSMGISLLIEAFMSLSGVMKIFQAPLAAAAKILGPFSEAITYVIEPLQTALIPIFNLLKPVMVVFAAAIQGVSALLMLLEPILNGLTTVLTWVSDAFVWVINGFISTINWVISWWGGKKIPLAKTSAQLDALAKSLENAQEGAKAYADSMMDAMDYITNKIKDEADKQVDAYRQLYEVGAITADQYTANVQRINDALKNAGIVEDGDNAIADAYFAKFGGSLEKMLSGYEAMAAKAKAVYDAAYADIYDPAKFNAAKNALTTFTTALVTAARTVGSAGGGRTGNGAPSGTPRYNVSSGIVGRSAQVSTSGDASVIVYVTVEGSVQAQEDLAASIAQTINTLRQERRLVV